jgi:hypothetical protein
MESYKKDRRMIVINIANDFSDAPGARYYTDGNYSGESFREELLVPAFESNEDITINLDNTEGYATSFLEESFGGLARKYNKTDVLKRITFISDEDPALIEEIISYIKEA